MNRYEFFNNCVSWDNSDVESLDEMIDQEEEISYEELTKHVTEEQLDEQFPFYRDCPLTLEKDWSVRYFKSTLHGKPCIFVRHSAIEYVFKPVL